MPRGDLRERFSTFDELEREFAGSEQSWLSRRELHRLNTFRSDRRRAAWTWGRVLSKRLILKELTDNVSPNDITIRSHDKNGRPTAPVVDCDGIVQLFRLSISHTDRAVFVAMTTDGEFVAGVDLVDLSDSEFSEASQRFWFTTGELQQMEQPDAASTRAFWAAKEAAFKSCRNSEQFAPRSIEVTAQTPTRFSAVCRFPFETRSCEILIRVHRQHLLAVATAGATNQKNHNRIHAYC